MNTPRAILALARADFLERTRRYSFFLALLFAVFLGYLTATGKVFIQFDEYRGLYTSGWIGTLVALVITCFVSLVGFYIVRNSVERDRTTGVGQILAATPLSKTTYVFGKFLSNFAVLSSMVAVLAVAALVMQFWAAEDSRIDLWALLSPFLLLALPAIALTAVSALCFEMLDPRQRVDVVRLCLVRNGRSRIALRHSFAPLFMCEYSSAPTARLFPGWPGRRVSHRRGHGSASSHRI